MGDWTLTDQDASSPKPSEWSTADDPSAGGYWDTIKNAAQTADDYVRSAANAVTFGMADRLAGALTPGSSTDAEVAKSETARERSPYASLAGDITGSMAIPGIGGEAVAGALGRQAARTFGTGMTGRLAQTAGRAVGYGGEGAVIGAAQGAGNTYTGNLPDYVNNALQGGAIGGALGGTLGGLFGPRQVNAAIPKYAEQKAATDALYDTLRNYPVPYSAAHFNARADQIEQQLRNQGFIRNAGYSPGSYASVDLMREFAARGQPVTPADIEVVRSGINNISASDASKVDRRAGRVVKQGIDDFMINPPPGAIPPGAQQAANNASALAAAARQSHAGAERTLLMERLEQRMNDLTQGQHSGRNFENVSRQQVNNITNPLSPTSRAKVAGFNAPEREAIEGLKYPGAAINTLRTVNNMLAGGGGAVAPVLAGLGVGATGYYGGVDPQSSALLGLGAVPLGFALRNASNRLARQRFQDVQDLVGQRNPLYQSRINANRGVPYTNAPSTFSPGQIANARDAIAYQLINRQP